MTRLRGFEAAEKSRVDLERRTYKSYQSRLNSHRRLRRRKVAWNASLVSTTTASTAAAVVLLKDEAVFGDKGPVLFALLSIATLVTSLVVSSVDYGGRTKAMEECYKAIQDISVRAEKLDIRRWSARQSLDRLWAEYSAIVRMTENHSTADFFRFERPDHSAKEAWVLIKDSLVTFAPYGSLAIPAVILAQIGRWSLG